MGFDTRNTLQDKNWETEREGVNKGTGTPTYSCDESTNDQNVK